MSLPKRLLLLAALATLASFATSTSGSADEQAFVRLAPVQDPLIQNPLNSPSPSDVPVQRDDFGLDNYRGSDNLVVAPSIFGEDRTAVIEGKKLIIPALIAPTTDVSQIGNRNLPKDFGGENLTARIPLPEGFADREPEWALTAYFWQAPNTFSHPLYFEEVMLERHGHERYRALQPMISGAKFFATLPMLPYLMTVQPACDFDYHLGYFRPGSCAPPLLQRPPYERRAAINQAAATAGAFLAIP